MKTTLLIMAVGIGSRFGTGIKQLATVDNIRSISKLVHKRICALSRSVAFFVVIRN